MIFFFFKQKTAYEMRISDWSSDVCSSDLFFVAGLSRRDDRDLDLGRTGWQARLPRPRRRARQDYLHQRLCGDGMSEFGILSFGAYVPITRLQRSAVHATNSWFAGGLRGLAKGEKAVANWDEDSVTMALEAARDALQGIDRASVQRVAIASTTLPFADRQNAGIVKEALNLPDAVGAIDIAGSQRAATSALLAALGGNETTLVTAAEIATPKPASEREMTSGDAAAAVIVGTGTPIATLIASYSVTMDFVDHFRETGEAHDYEDRKSTRLNSSH